MRKTTNHVTKMPEPSGISHVFMAAMRGLARPAAALFKRVRSIRKAGTNPEKSVPADAQAAEDALNVLTRGQQTSGLKGLATAVEAALVLPVILKTKSAREWLEQADVQADLTTAGNHRFKGQPVDPAVLGRLTQRYMDIAFASGPEAAPVVAAACACAEAVMSSSVNDKGIHALLVALNRDSVAASSRIEGKVDELLQLSAPSGSAPPPDLDQAGVTAWKAALRSASEDLLSWPSTLGGGQHLKRPELQSLIQAVQEGDRRAIVLLGGPGTGKSTLLACLGNEVVDDPEVSLLAIKGDLIDPEVTTEADLQRALGLPDLPSRMIVALSRAGKVVVLLDQLDALAGHLDLKTGRLSTLLNLAKVCGDIENVTLVVSCRTFEFSHDVRLSRINADSLELELPSWPDVLSVLEQHGVHAEAWAEDVRQVVRVPQQLKTFLSLHADVGAAPFDSYTRMLDELWSLRVLGATDGERLADTAFRAAEQMASREALWLARSRFDDRASELRALIASGLLVDTRGRVGFAHQTVFEHVLARQFARQDGSLSKYILGKKDSLFVRPKVWAALTYLRGVEPDSYISELRVVWSAPDLPDHLRFLLVEFLGSQQDPSDHEEQLLRTAWADERLTPLALKAIIGSAGWFERLAGNLIREAMGDSRFRDLCIPLLKFAWSHHQEAVSRLVLDRWLPLPDNDLRSLAVLQLSPNWSEALRTAIRTIAGRTELQPFRIDNLLRTVGAIDAAFAVDVLVLFLTTAMVSADAQVATLKVEAELNRPPGEEPSVAWYIRHNFRRPLLSLLEADGEWGIATSLAELVPGRFLFEMTRWVCAVCERLVSASREQNALIGFPLKYEIRLGADDETTRHVRIESIIDAILRAIELLGEADPPALLRYAEEFAGAAFTPVQRLVAMALTSIPELGAPVAHTLLLSDTRRLHLGNSQETNVTTRKLVQACSPFWTANQIASFVSAIQTYSPPRPETFPAAKAASYWLRMIRLTRVNLLRALPTNVRLGVADRAVQASGPSATANNSEFSGGFIGSPITKTQLMAASIDAIVNAFRKIPDTAEWDHPKHFMRGGNVQLSREFALMAVEQPERALQVISSLEPRFGQRAAGYGLDSLAEAGDASAVQSSLASLLDRGFESTEFRSSASNVVTKLAKRGFKVDARLLQAMESWVPSQLETDPSEVVERDTSDQSAETFLLEDSPDRLQIVQSDYVILAAVVQARIAAGSLPEAVQTLARYRSVSRDSDTWQSLVGQLATLLEAKADGIVDLVSSVLSIEELDGTAAGATLFVHAARNGLEEGIKANLPRWAASPNPGTRRGYGEVVGLLALGQPVSGYAAQWLSQIMVRDESVEERTGAAASAVHFVWQVTDLQARATDALLALLSRNEPGVWRRVFRLFAQVESFKDMPEAGRLFEAVAVQFINAPMPTERQFVEHLSEFLPIHAASVGSVAEQIVAMLASRLDDPQSLLAVAGDLLVDLALTLHRTEGTQTVGLRMFERLIEMDATQARAALDELDHRIRSVSSPEVPRIPRRPSGQRRRPLA